MMSSLREDQRWPEKSSNNGEDLCFTPATVLVAAIRQKKVSPVEVINAVYARLHEINPKINAFCTLTEEQARVIAKEAEAAVMRGNRLGASRRPRLDQRCVPHARRSHNVRLAHP
jgi:hypothetical protein